VFVNGGSGGVGTLVVQIAKAEGAYVVATGSEENAKLVKSLGADEVYSPRII
jgi:NADPH:quinone reductase-like Zn-dependent oxidoreductase